MAHWRSHVAVTGTPRALGVSGTGTPKTERSAGAAEDVGYWPPITLG